MRRLRNTETNVQVVVTDDKAAKLIAAGTYKAVPGDEQPPEDDEPQAPPKAKGKQGPTSIAAALRAEAGPMWDHAGQ